MLPTARFLTRPGKAAKRSRTILGAPGRCDLCSLTDYVSPRRWGRAERAAQMALGA